MQTPDVEDDLQWFELLAGRSAPEALAHTRTEAAWLRAAMLTYKLHPPAGLPPEPAQRIDDLMRRALAAGLFAERDLSVALAGSSDPVGALAETTASGRYGVIDRWFSRLSSLLQSFSQPTRWPLVLASVLAASWLLWTIQPAETGLDDTLRGGAPVQQIATRSIIDEQRRVLEKLSQAGFEASPFERLGRRGIELQVPEKPNAQQLKAIDELSLKLPAGPQLVIEFVERSAP